LALGATHLPGRYSEWKVAKHLKPEASPLDVTQSIDGQWIFVLTPGEVFAYPLKEDKVVNNISVV